MSSNYKGPQTSSVNKEKWDSTTTTVNSNSAVWANNSADIMVIAAASGGWNSTETIVNSNSSVWGNNSADIMVIAAASGGWNSVETTVNTNSAIWANNSADIMVIAAASGGWNSTETNLGTIAFSGSTIVNNVTATGEFLTIVVNGSAYAIELNIY